MNKRASEESRIDELLRKTGGVYFFFSAWWPVIALAQMFKGEKTGVFQFVIGITAAVFCLSMTMTFCKHYTTD